MVGVEIKTIGLIYQAEKLEVEGFHCKLRGF